MHGVVAFDVLSLVVENLKIPKVDHILEFAGGDDVVDRFGLEKVEGFAVFVELFLFHADKY